MSAYDFGTAAAHCGQGEDANFYDFFEHTEEWKAWYAGWDDYFATHSEYHIRDWHIYRWWKRE